MLTPEQVHNYERQSNAAAGLCADCMKPLEPDETHVCDMCYQGLVERDPNGRMCDEFTAYTR